jgi:hypothetical protein
MRIFSFPFYAILLSVHPIINLYSRNVVHIPFQDTARALALSAGFALFFLLSFRAILKDWQIAGLLCSLLAVQFFSYGHVAKLLESWVSHKDQVSDLSVLSWIWLLAFLILSFIIVRARLPERISQVFNLCSVILIAVPLVAVISFFAVEKSGTQQPVSEILSDLRGEEDAEASLRKMPLAELPHIYYIVFDEYARADILGEFYDYDNSPFVEALQSRGFYVAASGRSNYLSTAYSLNTTLNLVYFHELPTQVFRKARFNLQTNYVSEFLREQGYRIVVFDSGSEASNEQYADVFVSPEPTEETESVLNPFEQLLLRTTMGLLLYRRGSPGTTPEEANDVLSASVNLELSVGRERIRHALTHLPDYASKEDPHFLFAHIMLPHIPFLYGPDGEELKYHENPDLYWFEMPPEDGAKYYTYQIDYLNREILNTIDAILTESDRPVVIILQSDHGIGAYLDWDAPTAQGVDVRSAILDAVYFSDRQYDSLYPTMTSVNTFRITLNHWFGTQYPLLPDRVFFHEHTMVTPVNEKPDFIDSCSLLQMCLPAAPN